MFLESVLLKPYIRDNPRYMASEFLSVALQNIEDFKFEEARSLHIKMILSFKIFRLLIILERLDMKQ